jgi:hypothetical protein
MGENEPSSPTYVLDSDNQQITLSPLEGISPTLSTSSSSAIPKRSSSDPVVYTFRPLSMKTAPPSTHAFFSHIHKKFLDSITGITYQIAGISEMSAAHFENEYVYQFYDTAMYSTCPIDPDSCEFEPCDLFLQYSSYTFLESPTTVSRKTRRVNMVKTNKTYAFHGDSPVSVA